MNEITAGNTDPEQLAPWNVKLDKCCSNNGHKILKMKGALRTTFRIFKPLACWAATVFFHLYYVCRCRRIISSINYQKYYCGITNRYLKDGIC